MFFLKKLSIIGVFFVHEMLQEKLYRVAVSIVDAEVKVGWLKLWNENMLDKDVLHISKSPLSDSELDDWLSKSTYWIHLENIYIKELHNILSSPLQLPADVPTLSEYIQIWKFAAFNSIFYREFKSGKVKKHNTWDEQPNIDLAMKRVLYLYNLIFNICLIFFIACAKLSFNICLIIFLFVGFLNMF